MRMRKTFDENEIDEGEKDSNGGRNDEKVCYYGSES